MRDRKWLVVAAALLVGLAIGYLIWGGSGETSSPPVALRADSRQGPAVASDSSRPAPSRSPTASPSAKPATGSAPTSAGASSVEPAGSSGGAARERDEASPPAVTALVAPAGTIEGEVDFTGPVPRAGKLHREADPYCARTQIVDPTVLVQASKLANVWVHVTRGAPDAPPPAQPVEMDQQDCMYLPRVAPAVVGQKIIARNGDPILHNVHAYLGGSTVFNRGMPNEKATPIEYVPNQEGVMKWKCDVHPWMRGYIGISRNPLQSVTGAMGAFRIENVPPGSYTIEAWHEKYGAKSQKVTVQPGSPAKVIFKYDGTESGS